MCGGTSRIILGWGNPRYVKVGKISDMCGGTSRTTLCRGHLRCKKIKVYVIEKIQYIQKMENTQLRENNIMYMGKTIIKMCMGKPRKKIKQNLRYRKLNNKERGRGHYNRWMGKCYKISLKLGINSPGPNTLLSDL